MDLLASIGKRLKGMEEERQELIGTLAVLAKTGVVTYAQIGEALGMTRQAARQMCVRDRNASNRD